MAQISDTETRGQDIHNSVSLHLKRQIAGQVADWHFRSMWQQMPCSLAFAVVVTKGFHYPFLWQTAPPIGAPNVNQKSQNPDSCRVGQRAVLATSGSDPVWGGPRF